MKRIHWVALAALLCSSLTAAAQVGLYGEFSAAKINRPNTGWVYGPTLGAYYDPWHLAIVAAGVDVRVAFLNGGSTTLDSGLVGPRLVLTPHILPFKPYVEAVGGFGHAQFGQGVARQTSTNFEYQFLGGVDTTIFPRVDWRVVEFSYGGVSGLGESLNPETISTGLVVRLP